MVGREGGICLFTVESITVVVSIIVDLFVRDAGAAQGREGFRKVKGRERENYLEEYTWLL